LTGTLSAKTITVANEYNGPFDTRKTITYYSSATRLAATKASTEVSYEYTRQPASINNITGATITTTGTTHALRNYGYVGTITGSTITAKTTNAITNGRSDDLVALTSYTSNRLAVLTGCTPSADACALAYDTTQTINEEWTSDPATIDTIGAGNYISGTYYAIDNKGTINTMDSGDGATTIIYTSGENYCVFNRLGGYSKRTNTAATLTNATGTLTNNYTYEYAPATIGTIKNTYILGKRNAIYNGDGTANYLVTIGEIGEGAELRSTAAGYSAVVNKGTNARIDLISGGVFTTASGSGSALYNSSTTYPIHLTGGDFRGGDETRALAINDPDNSAKYTYPEGMALSYTTETATYHTLSNKRLTAKTNDYYYIAPNAVTLKFNANTGTGNAMDDQIVTVLPDTTAVTLSANTYMKEDNDFKGWALAADAGEPVLTDEWTGTAAELMLLLGETVKPGDEVTLYAVWKETETGITVNLINYTDEEAEIEIDGEYVETPHEEEVEVTLTEDSEITVTSAQACIVLYVTEDEEYLRQIPADGEDDTYTFAAGEDLAETVEIIIAFKGDANLDAVVDLDDIDVLDQWLYPKRDPDHVDLTDLQFLILDMDQSEDVDLDDSDVLDQYMYPKRDPDHAEIPWDN